MPLSVTHGDKILNILLVDDDDGDARAVERAFERAKIANPIRRATDGLEALDILRGRNGHVKLASPHISIVDLNMPRMNGIELLQAIRGDDELRQSIVFMLTTSKRDEDKAVVYDLNVTGYIIKPTAGQDLLNLVNMMGSYWSIVELPK